MQWKCSSHSWVSSSGEQVRASLEYQSTTLRLGMGWRMLLHPAELLPLFSKTCKGRWSSRVTGNAKALQQRVHIPNVTWILVPVFAYHGSLQCHNHPLSCSAKFLASVSAFHWLLLGKETDNHYFTISFRTHLKFTQVCCCRTRFL